MCECGNPKPWLLHQERETGQSVGYILWQASGRIPEAARYWMDLEFFAFGSAVKSVQRLTQQPIEHWRDYDSHHYIWPFCVFNDLKCQSNDYFVLFCFGHLSNLTWSGSSTRFLLCVPGFIKVLLYIAFMTIMIKVHTFPLFAIRPMYLAMR